MPKIKPHRTIPTIDMTAMVDVAFLLLTFFILTTRFKAADTPVDYPSSTGAVEIPPEKTMIITVTPKGECFIGFGLPETRLAVLQQVLDRRGLPPVSEEAAKYFSLQTSIGVPLAELNTWLKGDGARMSKYPQPGIPTGENGTRNELLDWVWAARKTDSELYYAIRGDVNAEYPAVKAIFATLQEYKINKFNLITNLEKGAAAPEAAEGEKK